MSKLKKPSWYSCFLHLLVTMLWFQVAVQGLVPDGINFLPTARTTDNTSSLIKSVHQSLNLLSYEALEALHRESAAACGWPEHTTERWRELKMDDWLRQQLRDPDFAEDFGKLFFKRALPDIDASTISGCPGLDDTCMYIGCKEISSRYKAEDRERVSMLLQSIVVLIKHTIELLDEVRHGFTELVASFEYLFKEYTWVVRTRTQDEIWRQNEMAIIRLIGLLLFTVAAVSGLATMNPAWPATNAFIPVMTNTFAGAWASYASHFGSHMPKEWLEDADLDFQRVVDHMRDIDMEKLKADAATVLRGKIVGKNPETKENYDLGYVFCGGRWLSHSREGKLKNLKLSIRKNTDAMILQYFWGRDHTYINVANTTSEGCEYDFRGSQVAKHCSPSAPDKSFWFYSVEGGTSEDARLFPPAGLIGLRTGQLVGRQLNVTIEEIVIESMKWYSKHGNKYVSSSTNTSAQFPCNADLDWFTRIGDKVEFLPGAMALPIAIDPHGSSISSVEHTRSRNLPCMVGNMKWIPPKGHDVALGYPTNDETFHFLNRTGLIYNANIHRICRGNGDDAPDYWKDTSINWGEGEYYIPGAKSSPWIHPFKSCCHGRRHRWCDNEFSDALSYESWEECNSVLKKYCWHNFPRTGQPNRKSCSEGYIPNLPFWWRDDLENPCDIGTRPEPNSTITSDVNSTHHEYDVDFRLRSCWEDDMPDLPPEYVPDFEIPIYNREIQDSDT